MPGLPVISPAYWPSRGREGEGRGGEGLPVGSFQPRGRLALMGFPRGTTSWRGQCIMGVCCSLRFKTFRFGRLASSFPGSGACDGAWASGPVLCRRIFLAYTMGAR